MDNDTIIAPATPPGEGGIGILRLSGGNAEKLLYKFFTPAGPFSSFTSHRLYLGNFSDQYGNLIDEVMAVVMRAPRSYTREDVVEVHCHGGLVVMRRILDQFVEAGVRLARPGEFTLRAFINGRLDLSQAEAVIDLIRARSDSAGRIAAAQLKGSVFRAVHELQADIADLLALIEAHVDFPEDDIEFADQDRLLSNAARVLSRIDVFLKNFDSGRILREGLSVLILGKPNVGKSSLLNILLGESRAIVTAIAGTTRDTIEENLVLGGVPLRLIDTAGVRITNDPVESEGVARAKSKIASSDLVLLVVDGSRQTDEEDLLALEACQQSTVLLVENKADLARMAPDDRLAHLPRVSVSTKSGDGIEKLKTAIIGLVCNDSSASEANVDLIFSDRRHREALLRCGDSINRFIESLALATSPEFLALDLREALQALGEITGETTPDHILDRIFTRFCIGK
jgi:tRNA modification GTPase